MLNITRDQVEAVSRTRKGNVKSLPKAKPEAPAEEVLKLGPGMRTVDLDHPVGAPLAATEELPKEEAQVEATRAPSIGATGFKIDKGVAMPTSQGGGGKAKYPWNEMQPGDSFFVAEAKIETFYTLTSTARKKYGHQYVARKWQEGDINGVRVWRVEA